MPSAVSQLPSRRRIPGSTDGVATRSRCSGSTEAARRCATSTATSSGQPSGRAHALGDRGGELGRLLGVQRAGRGEHARRHLRQPVQRVVGRRGAPATTPLENSTSVAPCSSTCSATTVAAPGTLPSGGRGRQRQEGGRCRRRATTSGGGWPGRRVGEVAGAGVEDARRRPRRPRRRPSAPAKASRAARTARRRRVAQRGGAHGAAQPAHRAGGRHAVADGVADDQRHAPGPERTRRRTSRRRRPARTSPGGSCRTAGGRAASAGTAAAATAAPARRRPAGLGHSEVSVAASSDSRTSSAPRPPATRIGRTMTVADGPPAAQRAADRLGLAGAEHRRRPGRRPGGRRRPAGRPARRRGRGPGRWPRPARRRAVRQ